MHASADSRQMAVLLRISTDIDIVGDVSVVVENPSELLAWAHVLPDPSVRAWRAGVDGHRFVHVTDLADRSPVRGRVTAILKGDRHRDFWDALLDHRDLEAGEDVALRVADLGAAWKEMPIAPPAVDAS